VINLILAVVLAMLNITIHVPSEAQQEYHLQSIDLLHRGEVKIKYTHPVYRGEAGSLIYMPSHD